MVSLVGRCTVIPDRNHIHVACIHLSSSVYQLISHLAIDIHILI